MALWMTVEQECFGLAALLFAFSCVFWRGNFRAGGRGRGKSRRLAFFVIWMGLLAGMVRMEYEEWRIKTEQNLIEQALGSDATICGRVVEICDVDYGVRLKLGTVRLIRDERLYGKCDSEEEIWQDQPADLRGAYVYLDSTDGLALGMELTCKGRWELPEPDRNPGGFDYRSYCLSKGVSGIFYADEWNEGQMEELYWWFRERLRQVGLIAERQLEEIADPEDMGILKAVLLGQKSDMDDEIYRLYRQNGLSHLLAISGLHVSVVGMGIWKCLRKFGMGYVQSGLIAFAVLLCYGSVTGFGPSVVRAVFMMGISFLAGIFGRTYDLPSAMCIPALGLLLRRPYLLTQVSFQLSFLAVGAMFFPGRYLADVWAFRGLRQKIWISLSLQLMTLPVVLTHSFEIPVFGIVLNLVAVPLMAYVLISGILGVVGGFLLDGLGRCLLGGAHYILLLYRCLCLWVQEIPGANWILGCPEPWEIILYYILILVGIWMAVWKGKRWMLLWGLGIILLLPRPRPGLSVTFLDVGQGDGIFLEASGKTMLVDCGSSQEKHVGEEVLIPFLKSRGIGKLDTIVVSHGDLDHMSGIRDLLEDPDCGIAVGGLILPETSETDKGDRACQELAQLARIKGINVEYCGAGDLLTDVLGEKIEVLCLHPDEKGERIMDRNENSQVFYLTYRKFSMLLTGDIGEDTEYEIMERYLLAPVTVLKAAHHGSATSTGKAFLEAVCPAYVILSYGEGNAYGHPSPQVVERCGEAGAEIYETARSGALQLWTDGRKLRLEGWLDRHGGI